MLLMAHNNMTLYLSQKFLRFIFEGLKILKDREASMREKAACVTSITSVKQDEHSDSQLELKENYEREQLRYVMGLLYTIVQCQIIRSEEVVQWSDIAVMHIKAQRKVST